MILSRNALAQGKKILAAFRPKEYYNESYPIGGRAFMGTSLGQFSLLHGGSKNEQHM